MQRATRKSVLAVKFREIFYLLTKPEQFAEALWVIDSSREYQWHPVMRQTYDRLDAEERLIAEL